jgi:hypothetical protein
MTIKKQRSNRMYNCRLLLFGLIAVFFSSICFLNGDEAKKAAFFEKQDSEVEECRISLYLGSTQAIDWRTKDVKLMKELFLDPLANARENPKPAAYEMRGSIAIRRTDGSEENFTVFYGWGKIKRDDKYLIADLQGLRRVLKEALTKTLESL